MAVAPTYSFLAHTGEPEPIKQTTSEQEKHGETLKTAVVITSSVEDTIAIYPIDSRITTLPSEPYKLLKPIPVTIAWVADHEFLASFQEANIAMTGDNPQDAFQNLLAEILDTYEDYTDDGVLLGPEPQRQLEVLKTYLAPKSNATSI